MGDMKKLMVLMLLAGSSMFAATRVFVGFGFGGYAPAPVAVYAPPPAPVYSYGYAVPHCPGPDYGWVNGYWYPSGPRYAWRAGYWARRPYPRAYWVGPRYYRGSYYHGYWRR